MTLATNDKNEENRLALVKAISEMPEEDRKIGMRLHELITSVSPRLFPRTWYGMPAYSVRTKNSGDKILCFFRSRKKFGERFMTFGFNDLAMLDEGNMWPISYAIINLTPIEEEKIIEIVKKAL